MDRDEFIENLRTRLLWEAVCAHIEVMAAGRLDIPNTEDYPYDSHDFVAMGKKELLSFSDIVSISSITYSDVELLSSNVGRQNR